MIDTIRRQLDDILDFLRTRPGRLPARRQEFRAELLEARVTPVTTEIATFDPAGGNQLNFTPFGAGYEAGVSTALADVTGDGVADVIVGTGPGVDARVAVFDGKNNKQVSSFLIPVFEQVGGVNVTAFGIDDDSKAEVVVSVGAVGGARVFIYDGASVAAGSPIIRSFLFPFPGLVLEDAFRLSVGDVDQDGLTDILVTPGVDGPPRMQAFNGLSSQMVVDVIPFDPALTSGGAYAAFADLDGDIFGEFIFGAGQGSSPQVRVATAPGVVALFQQNPSQPVILDQVPSVISADFISGNKGDLLGVTVAAADLNQSATDDIITGSGGVIRAYEGKALLALPNNPTTLFTAVPFPGRTNLLSVAAFPTLTQSLPGRIAAGPIIFPPTLGPIENQTATAGTPVTVAITLGDTDQNPGTLTLTAASGNATLIPPSGFVFGGTGANRTLTFTPAANRFGTTSVTVTVTDADNQTVSQSFFVTVRLTQGFNAITPGNLIDTFVDVLPSTNPYDPSTTDIGGAEVQVPGGLDLQARLFNFPTTQISEINGGVAVLNGDVFFAAFASGNAYSGGGVDDITVLFRYSPTTDTLIPLATFNRESGGLAVGPSGDLLNVWFDGVYGNNPYGSPDSASIGLSRIDPQSGAETVLFSEPVAFAPGTSGALIPRPTGVAESGGKVFFATSLAGRPGGTVAAVDDKSTLRRFDPATGKAATLATFNRETNGLATAPDGTLVEVWFDGVYGNNPYSAESATIGISRIDPGTGAQTILASDPVPGLPQADFLATTPKARPRGVTVIGGSGKVAYAVSSPTTQLFDPNTNQFRTVTNTTDLRLFDPATGKVATLAATSRQTTGLVSVPLLPVGQADAFTTSAGVTLDVPALGVLANDSSPNIPGPLRAIPATAPPATEGTLTLNPNGSFTFVPAAGFQGTTTFTYRVTDGLATSLPVTVTITVVNQPPVAVPDSFTTRAGQQLTVPAPGLLANDTDPEGDPLQAQLVTPLAAEQGTLTLNPDGSFTFTPRVGAADAFTGVATFTYRVFDGINTSAPVLVSITVTNQAPVAVNDSYSTPAGSGSRTLTPSILANDFDPDSGPLPLRFTIDLIPPSSQLAAFTVLADGTIRVTPAPGFVGTATFTYRVFDGANFSAPATGTITVTNATPIGRPDAFSVQAGQTLSIAAPGVLANDSDPDGNPLQAIDVTQPASGGSVVLNTDGSFAFTPQAGFVGVTTFTYRVTDGIVTSAPVVVTITVTAPPVTTAVIGGQVFLDANNNGVRDSTGLAPPIDTVPPGVIVLPRNDDESTDKLDFGFSFDFFGKSYTQFFVNNNGNITFNQPLFQFTPDGFPQSIPIVAPFWADVDTRGELSAEVRLTRGTSSRGNPFVQIDWAGVGYFARHEDLLNDFTLYIEDDANGDLVAFIYRDMQWTTGDASDGEGGFGGSGAQIGFDTGTGMNFQDLGRPDSDAALAPFRNTRFVFRMDASGTPQLFSEPGLDGRTIELVGPDGNVVATAVSQSVDLDGNGTINPITERGLYRFDNLPPGKYTVRLVQEAGFTQTLPANNGVYDLEVIAGDESLGNLFGVFQEVGPRERLFAVGAAAGGSPRVRVFNADGTERFSFIALDGDTSFSGGIRVAVGDVNGDGVDDIIVGAGTGGGPRVEVYDGVTGNRIANFFAYEPSFRGGVHVAAADVDGDGFADVITGAGSTGDPRLRVFSGALIPTFDGLASQSLHDFYAFPLDLIGGVRVAAGDLDGDGIAEIVAAAGPSGDTEVRVYDGRSGALVSAFAAFTPGYRGGLFVGVIGAQPEGRGSIVISKDSVTDYDGSVFSNLFPDLPPQAVLSPPAVVVFDYVPGLSGQPAPQATLSPYEPTFLEGVRTTGGIVASGSQLGEPDEAGFVTAPGAGGDSLIRVFRYRNGVPELDREFQAFEPGFLGGVFVGASS